MPETWAQAAVVLTLVVPGFVYRASWQSVAGPDPARPDFGTRVLHAMVATGLFGGVYAAALGPAVTQYGSDPALALDDVRGLAVAFLVLALGLPWASARVEFSVASSRRYGLVVSRALGALRLRPVREAAPRPWDHAFGHAGAGWVRVRFADGRWLGGVVRRPVVGQLAPGSARAVRGGSVGGRRGRRLHGARARPRRHGDPLRRRDRRRLPAGPSGYSIRGRGRR